MKTTIGRVDKADFKELSLEDIDIKIDSGAYTSSIHCSNIEEITIVDNTKNRREKYIDLLIMLLKPSHLNPLFIVHRCTN